eukprot:769842-Rhodomonas_salina.1
MLAAGAGAEAVCRLLLDSTAGQEVDAVDQVSHPPPPPPLLASVLNAVTRCCGGQFGQTALYKAARGGFALVLDLLVARKANVNLAAGVSLRTERGSQGVNQAK